MIDALVMTLGFEPGPLLSAIASAAAEGFNQGAQILVLTAAFPDERAERAWLELQRIVGMMNLPKELGVRLERREVELSDFVRAVRRVKEVLAPLRDKRIRLSITGGMRALNLAVFTAYLLIDWAHEPRIDVYLEGRGTALTLPSLHRILTLNLTETQRLILSAMREGMAYTSSDLSAHVRKDRSTVYKNLLALQRLGLVAREGNRYRVTELGAMILNSKPPQAVD